MEKSKEYERGRQDTTQSWGKASLLGWDADTK